MKYKYLHFLLWLCLLSGFVACETNKEANLLGEWEIVSIKDEDGAEMVWQKPTIWEFTKDNKVYANSKLFGEWSHKDKDIIVSGKLYNLTGEYLGTQIMTVTKLTDEMLILEDPQLSFSTASTPVMQKITFKKI